MIGISLLKQKILESAFTGKLTELTSEDFKNVKINEIMQNYDSKRKPVSKDLRGNLENNYDYYGATGKIDMINDYIFDGNYLLIGEDGGNFFVDRDNSFIVDGKFWANNHVHVLSSGNEITNRYVMHYLNSLNLPKMGLISGVAVPKLNQRNLNSISIPLCSNSNQEIIVNKIDELFSLVDRKEKNDIENNRLKVILREKVLKCSIQGNLTKLDLDRCETIRFDKVFDIINGFTPLRTNKEFWEDGTIPWFTVDDIKNQGHIINETIQHITSKALGNNSKRLLPKNTTILCCTSATIGNYAYTNIELATNQQWNGLVIKEEFIDKIEPKFVYYFVQTLKQQMLIDGNSTTFPFISVKKLGEYEIFLPPIEEQKRIVEKIESLFELIEQL